MLSLLFLYCLASLTFSALNSSRHANDKDEPVGEVKKKTVNGRPVRDVQVTSTFQSSDCSQQNGIPRSCYHAKLLGHSVSGIYEIDPRDRLGSFDVYCDMETDGGGWTVFQRRKDGSENFYRNWATYKEGFGELYGEFWLGLDKIHRLSASCATLRVDMMATDNSKAYATYEDFTIGNEKSSYVMHIGRYSGTAGDSLTYNNNMKFSTYDRDNDKWSSNCASSSSSGLGSWWYKHCTAVNLNGQYRYGDSSRSNVIWESFKSTASLKKVEMKLK
jgi:ficolin